MTEMFICSFNLLLVVVICSLDLLQSEVFFKLVDMFCLVEDIEMVFDVL